MGISNYTSRLPFVGKHSASSSDGDTSRSEKQNHAGYSDGPVPRVTIHSFIMGVFVSMGGMSPDTFLPPC